MAQRPLASAWLVDRGGVVGVPQRVENSFWSAWVTALVLGWQQPNSTSPWLQVSGTEGPFGSSNIQEQLLPFDLSIFKTLHQVEVRLQ